jgi:hypothetical protein
MWQLNNITTLNGIGDIVFSGAVSVITIGLAIFTSLAIFAKSDLK